MGTNNTEKFKVAFLCIPDLMAVKVVIDMGSLISKELMGQKQVETLNHIRRLTLLRPGKVKGAWPTGYNPISTRAKTDRQPASLCLPFVRTRQKWSRKLIIVTAKNSTCCSILRPVPIFR